MSLEQPAEPGSKKWYIERGAVDPDLHPDTTKDRDPVEELLKQRGPGNAVAELEERLNDNPNDSEARRQLSLIRNRLSDLLSRINNRIQH